MPRTHLLLLLIFSIAFLTSVWVFSGESQLAGNLVQLAAAVSLEGIVLVVLLAAMDSAREARVLRAINQRIKAAALSILSVEADFWLTVKSDDDTTVRMILQAQPQLRRRCDQAMSILPALAVINHEHLQRWCDIVDTLSRICDTRDNQTLLILCDDFKKAVAEFSQLRIT